MSFVGSYINPEVVQQLTNRSKILFKNDKTPEDIHYIGSRSAWVRLISGVNIGEDVRPAKEFILSNVINIDNDGKTSLNGGINFENSTGNNLYNYTQDYGIRPKPGITGFSIVSKNRFGTIREATVTFTVWSLDEFNTIENLYLRPGYQAVVEWGHTIYLDNDNTVAYTPPNKLDGIFKAKTLQEVAGILETNKKECDFNYDGFIGFIKNFSWSFRKDGGYDCTVSIISAGEILESLTMSINTTEDEVDAKEQSTENVYTAVHSFLELLHKVDIGQGAVTTEGDEYKITLKKLNAITTGNVTRNDNYKTIISKLKKLEYKDSTPIGIGAPVNNSMPFRKDKEIWIPLGLLLDILNSFYMPYVNECNNPPAFIKFDSKSLQKLYTFNGHHSLDPLTCLIITGDEQYTLRNKTYQNILQSILKDFYTSRIQRRRGDPTPEKSGDNICNILVNCNIIKEEIDEIKDRKISVLSFVKNLLQRIQDALGDINEFDIDFNEQDFTFSIVDRKLSPNYSTNETASNLPPELILTGKESIFTDLSIQSKISSALASQIAISAQSSSPNPGNTIPAMLDWNIGLTNRYLPETTMGIRVDCEKSEEIIPDNPIKEAIQKSNFWTTTLKLVTGITYLENIINSWKRRSDEREKYRNSFDGLRNIAFDHFHKDILQSESTFSGIQPNIRVNNDDAAIKYFTALKIKGREEFGKQDGIKAYDDGEQDRIKTAQGIIPVELSFTTDGIGGLIIGQSFKVGPKILPTKYDLLGFIITGLDHKIEGGKWLTTVKAQTYIIPNTVIVNSNTTTSLPTLPPTSTITPSPGPEQPVLRPQEPSSGEEAPVEDESKFWTLVAICAREDNNPQGHADVAQSIYNRLKAPRDFYKTNIIELITGNQEYEPTWKYPKPGEEGKANQKWKEIVNPETAAQASGLTQENLLRVASAIQNPELQQKAKDFILGRTDFFGATINSNKMRLPVRRTPKSNQFGFRWKYQPKDQNQNPIAGTPAEVPSFVNAVKLNIV